MDSPTQRRPILDFTMTVIFIITFVVIIAFATGLRGQAPQAPRPPQAPPAIDDRPKDLTKMENDYKEVVHSIERAKEAMKKVGPCGCCCTCGCQEGLECTCDRVEYRRPEVRRESRLPVSFQPTYTQPVQPVYSQPTIWVGGGAQFVAPAPVQTAQPYWNYNQHRLPMRTATRGRSSGC